MHVVCVIRVWQKPLNGTKQIPRANKHQWYVVQSCPKCSTNVMSLLSVWWFGLVAPK
jgi:hypothetical protein